MTYPPPPPAPTCDAERAAVPAQRTGSPADHYHQQVAQILTAAIPALAGWRDARQQLTAAYAAVDTAPDNQWRATIAALVAARAQARKAALALSGHVADLEVLTDALPRHVRSEVRTVEEIAETAGVDVTDWPDASHGFGSLGYALEDALKAQDEHIAEINRLATGPSDIVVNRSAGW